VSGGDHRWFKGSSWKKRQEISISYNNNNNNNNSLEAVPAKHSIDSVQKTAILGTSHIIRKVLQCEARSVSGGDHRWFKRSTGKKRPVTGDIHIV